MRNSSQYSLLNQQYQYRGASVNESLLRNELVGKGLPKSGFHRKSVNYASEKKGILEQPVVFDLLNMDMELQGRKTTYHRTTNFYINCYATKLFLPFRWLLAYSSYCQLSPLKRLKFTPSYLFVLLSLQSRSSNLTLRFSFAYQCRAKSIELPALLGKVVRLEQSIGRTLSYSSSPSSCEHNLMLSALTATSLY